ncbi:MAG: sigma 54-dependent Fis family transcriptional regulator [Labilithrix sp.]|nr:sigma 54-dependent Fis family transcriptional regulator [Labilithrix sp.]MCW5812832.1 sigma 54-dependent Fis family transcriptional regulator [Labilithrix sp.]
MTDVTKPIERAAQPPLGARVVVVGAKARPSPFMLERGSCVLGSAPGADIVIDDRAVSRSHVELSIVNGGIDVRDLGSRNGTFYLGQRVQHVVLRHGASLTVGAARVLLEADTESFDDLSTGADELRGLFGASPAMRRIFAILKRLESSTVTVLVQGESGVGKELVARALHAGSGVPGPLVTFNCGAIARELVTSELFGHRRGAFTGAVDARRGAFDAADRGTLFLDEVGELPLDAQPSLLRALEAGEVRAVGADHATTVRVRVIAATHRDLEREVREGRFREDLYYRLAVIKLDVPPLRERRDDIPLLAQRFARAAGADPLPDDVIEKLKVRAWPGNARELRNVVQAYCVLGRLPPGPRSAPVSLDEPLAAMVDVARPYAELKDELLDRFQRVYLTELLTYVRGNQTAAAKLARMDRTYLGKLLARHRIGAPVEDE